MYVVCCMWVCAFVLRHIQNLMVCDCFFTKFKNTHFLTHKKIALKINYNIYTQFIVARAKICPYWKKVCRCHCRTNVAVTFVKMWIKNWNEKKVHEIYIFDSNSSLNNNLIKNKLLLIFYTFSTKLFLLVRWCVRRPLPPHSVNIHIY